MVCNHLEINDFVKIQTVPNRDESDKLGFLTSWAEVPVLRCFYVVKQRKFRIHSVSIKLVCKEKPKFGAILADSIRREIQQLFYFASLSIFPSWTSRGSIPVSRSIFKEVMLMRNKEMKAALEASE